MNRILTDRSSGETDDTCGQKYWWYKFYNGTGIVPVVEAEYFAQGRQIHNALEKIAEAEDPMDGAVQSVVVITDDMTLAEKEVASRFNGWVWAFAQYIEPLYRQQFETIALEHELVLEHDDLWVATTPDRILRDRKSGKLVVDDYKSFNPSARGWADHWPYAIQCHVQIKAVEKELGEKVAYGRIRGVNKGFNQKGLLRHPYTWAYRRGSEWRPDYAYGWEQAPLWERPGGMREWVSILGKEVAINQFPLSQPIFLNERLLARYLAQRAARERDIAQFLSISKEAGIEPSMVDSFPLIFPAHYKECRPIGMKGHCSYLAACHNKAVGDNPIASGLYVPRTPHHELELTLQEESEGETE